MPNRITKQNFRNHFSGKTLDLEEAGQDSRVTDREKGALKKADMNGDGKIRGQRETDRLFKELDHFDRDGRYSSMYETEYIQGIMEAAREDDPGHSITKGDFLNHLKNKRVRLVDLQLNPTLADEVKEAVARADVNGDGKIQGSNESKALFARLDDFDRDGSYGSMDRTASVDAVLASAVEIPLDERPTIPDGALLGDLSYSTNSAAVSKARNTTLGRLVPRKVRENFDVYAKASELTGVPMELIIAVHANESQLGTYRPSTHGPEAGFGLDPRFVKTSWGNEHLARYGLGRWKRGQAGKESMLQSAVVAAEHLRRQAGYAGVTLKPSMNQKELAGAVTGYVQGNSAGRRAKARGRSWLFDPNDSNPHPRHPGGSSIGSGGRRIYVRPSRKPGLLRWDALLPLIEASVRDVQS